MVCRIPELKTTDCVELHSSSNSEDGDESLSGRRKRASFIRVDLAVGAVLRRCNVAPVIVEPISFARVAGQIPLGALVNMTARAVSGCCRAVAPDPSLSKAAQALGLIEAAAAIDVACAMEPMRRHIALWSR